MPSADLDRVSEPATPTAHASAPVMLLEYDSPAVAGDDASAAETNATVVVRPAFASTSGYLSVTGTIPLRFRDGRDWPAPLPKAVAEELHIALVEPAKTPDVAPASSPVVEAKGQPASVSQPVVQRTVVPATLAAVAQPTKSLLTAEMVLGYFDNLPSDTGRRVARFEPPQPEADAAAIETAVSSP